MPAQGIIRGHELVIDEGVHEQSLLDKALPLLPLGLEVPVCVVGDHNTVGLEGQLHNEAVIVAHYSLATHAPRWCEHQDLLLLQFPQDVLVCDGHFRPWLLLPPRWYEHCDVSVTPLQEPVHGQQNAPAGEDLLVPMAHGHIAPIDDHRPQIAASFVLLWE
jgi:hypothetical protein